MTGLEKCEELRKLRREIARANGVDMDFPDCPTRPRDCRGTCPACEEELERLSSILGERERAGERLVFPLAPTDWMNREHWRVKTAEEAAPGAGGSTGHGQDGRPAAPGTAGSPGPL